MKKIDNSKKSDQKFEGEDHVGLVNYDMVFDFYSECNTKPSE